LFLVYVNDIANAALNQTVNLFAHDANLFLARSTVSSAADVANNTSSKYWQNCYYDIFMAPYISNATTICVSVLVVLKSLKLRVAGMIGE